MKQLKKDILDKLNAYEQTGLTPDEVERIKAAGIRFEYAAQVKFKIDEGRDLWHGTGMFVNEKGEYSCFAPTKEQAVQALRCALSENDRADERYRIIETRIRVRMRTDWEDETVETV